ncbi:MAG: DUF554 family protein [Clostridia bacterium]|nr:DUF554 family protein [Clostridia bacterium]
MGIIVNALSIFLGVLLGGLYKNRLKFKISLYLAIAVIIISLLGFLENAIIVSDNRLLSANTLIIIFSLVIGSYVGDSLKLEEKINECIKRPDGKSNGFLDAFFLFGIGGLQISGPILMVLNGDNSQLFLKALIDFPLGLLIGANYGKVASLSFIPVAILQCIIAVIAHFLGGYISQEILMSLCSMGFVILFFTGYNMLSTSENKIKNINMVPSVFLVIIFHVIKGFVV